MRSLSLRVGRAPSFISRLEGGTRTIDLIEFIELTRALGLDPLAKMKEFLDAAQTAKDLRNAATNLASDDPTN
jgi:hypothetical protein